MKNLVPELVSTERIFDEYFKIDEKKFLIKKEGSEDKEISRLSLVRPDAVAVLIYNEELETFTFVHQYRPAIGDKNDDTPILEIAAGLIDEGESPEVAAEREVLEETGYKVDNLQLLYDYYPGVGYCSERVYVYIAYVSKNDKIEAGGGLEIEGEMMDVVEFSVNDTFDMFNEGQFVDGKTIMTLQYFMASQIENYAAYQEDKVAELEQKIKDLETANAILKKNQLGNG